MADEKVVWFYVGAGAYFPGVPRQDLTQADLDRLTDSQRADVEAGTIYQRSKPTGGRAALTQVPTEGEE